MTDDHFTVNIEDVTLRREQAGSHLIYGIDIRISGLTVEQVDALLRYVESLTSPVTYHLPVDAKITVAKA